MTTSVVTTGKAATKAANKAKNSAKQESVNRVTKKKAEISAAIVEPVVTIDKSKSQLKIEQTIANLLEIEAGRGLTPFEYARLANAYEKLESRSLSRLYRELSGKHKDYVKCIALGEKAEGSVFATGKAIGTSMFPSFADWAAKMPKKNLYSFYDGIRVLATFNKVAMTKAKVEKQNKAEAKK